MKQLQQKIMRRIYYAYMLRLVSLPGIMQGFAMLAILIALTHFVSLGNVLNNFSQIQVSHLDTFFYNAVRTTEAWTLLLIGLFVYCLLSIRFQLFRQEVKSYEYAGV
jgi:hypothetical protein